MNEIITEIIGLLVVGIVIYSCGFNSGYKYAVDIFTGKRKVKPSKNPFLKYRKDM